MTIFFDIDKTLLDDKYAVKQACLAIQHKFSDEIDIHIKDFLQIWNEALEEYFKLYLEGKITFQEQRMKRVAKVFELDKNQMEHGIADEIFQFYLKEYENNWRLFADARPCLEELRDNTLGIISNGDSTQQIKKLRKMGIKNYFKSINISSKVGHSKPEQKIFKHACNSLNTDPKNCVYIGDKFEDDAMACEKIGMTGVWLNRKQEKRDTGDLKAINNLEDLPDLLQDIIV
ncbi:MAG: HAD family hydrolase [Patescibacteria group bacterium]